MSDLFKVYHAQAVILNVEVMVRTRSIYDHFII